MVLGLLMLSLMATRHSFMTALISKLKELWQPFNGPFPPEVVPKIRIFGSLILVGAGVLNHDAIISSKEAGAQIRMLSLGIVNIALSSQKLVT